MPCEQQTISLGQLAIIKALDGRMWWGMVAWLRVWCMFALCFGAEQPDVYICDFYDAAYITTSPSEWDEACNWQKRTLLFYRGCKTPTAPYPGRRGTSDWHNGAGRNAIDVAHARDETHVGFAKGLAEQIQPNVPARHPSFVVEVERLAAAFHSAGLPIPHDYNSANGYPTSEADALYATTRGQGDGRRVQGVIPLLSLPQDQRLNRLSQDKHYDESFDPSAIDELLSATCPVVSPRGRALGKRAADFIASEQRDQSILQSESSERTTLSHINAMRAEWKPVSDTHLTLPTNR